MQKGVQTSKPDKCLNVYITESVSENYEGHCFEGQDSRESPGEIKNGGVVMAIEQQGHVIMERKNLSSTGLLTVGGVGSGVTARCGDAPTSPPGPRPKSLAAVPLGIFRQALKEIPRAGSVLLATTLGQPQMVHLALRRLVMPATSCLVGTDCDIQKVSRA